MAEEHKKSKGWLGYLLIAVAVMLVIVAFAMFSQTWGTKLLYIDATTGRICRFYWVVFAIAMVILAVGIFTLKKHPKQVKTQTEEKQEDSIEEKSSETIEVNEVAEATIKEEE